ncbi:TipAS antibiotic-recognition domain-containing protein [Deefgea tanakiae]|uniref:TipAS antibiotic-recognition domain-containing protein n=1 Tax=Deefgea tanakiae TaxID=2865840 RepID=A0ABX8Z6L3_9NEIS|nr:TipAS antibiotic-recognition domain-containing protein [Deefgea tanakiae]QZA77435.1 TipAS antibiotic-recognition domain-containing protein [Deefgea tanakiae]
MKQLNADYLEQCRQALQQEQTASLATSNNWAHVDRPKVHADWDALYKKLSQHIGVSDANDAAVQSLMDEHFAIATRFYTPSKLAYIGMGIFYRENADMATFHNGYHPEMVNYLGDAMVVYANQKL